MLSLWLNECNFSDNTYGYFSCICHKHRFWVLVRMSYHNVYFWVEKRKMTHTLKIPYFPWRRAVYQGLNLHRLVNIMCIDMQADLSLYKTHLRRKGFVCQGFSLKHRRVNICHSTLFFLSFSQVRIYLWFFACLAVAVFPTLPVAMGFVDRRFV